MASDELEPAEELGPAQEPGLAQDLDPAQDLELAGDLDVRELLDWAVEQSPLSITLWDTAMRQVQLNEAACRQLGLPAEALLGRRPTDLFPSPLTELAVAQGRLVARTGESARLRLVGRGRRRERAWEVWLSPVRDPAGQTRGVLTVSMEVTEQHQARQRLALVNEASTRIGTTLDVTRTCEELIEVSVPQFADLALIDVLESVLGGGDPVSGPVGTAPMRRMAIGSVLDGTPEVVVRPGEVSSYPGPSPFADCLTTGRTARYDSRAPDMVEWAALSSAQGSSIARYGMHSMVAVPVRARGDALGIAIFVRHRRADPFEDDDVVLAEEIVARAAVCIDNARRYTREHATALALQNSLLQQAHPVQSAVEVATRYRPAQSGVGGDWFDVIRLSGSRVGLVVGDVVGHGIHAAATMGRLRTAVRTLADIDLEPEELLTRLDDVVGRMAAEAELSPGGVPADLSATCLYAVYDPVSRRCSMARAGHPVPAVVDPGGSVEFLDLPAGPPLGLGGLPFEETEIEVPEGSLLVLFTDGLVESRQRDIDAGLTAMRKILSEVHAGQAAPPSLEMVCDRLVGNLLPDRAADDAAVLVARTCALRPDRIACQEVTPEPSEVSQARAWAVRQLAVWGLEGITFTTELLVSELVTNAIRHAQPPIQLRLIWDEVLSVEVSDGSSTAPHLRRADRWDEDGRGLMLVAQLAERWGTRHTRTGKTIWAQV